MNAPPDSTIRYALAAWLADPAGGLTPEQRTWLTQRLMRLWPLTPREVERLGPPLTAWVERALPRCAPLLRTAMQIAAQ